MSTILDNGLVTQLPGDYLKSLLNVIASEVHIKDYDIIFKQQEFTGDNYCGEITRVQIIPREGNNHQKTLHLIVKKAPTDANSRAAIPVHNLYVAEMFAYSTVIPAFYRLYDEYNISNEGRFLSATFYKGSAEELKEILILKDLSGDGFIMADKRFSFDYDHAALVLQTLARIHAASFVMKEKHPEQFYKITDNLSTKCIFGEKLMTMLENVARASLLRIENPKNRVIVQPFVDEMREKCFGTLDASLSEPYNVICHGDAWVNNMLFKYNEDKKLEEVVLIDWQVVRYASPLSDVCYILCLSSDEHLLRSHLDQLLNLYYETLGISMKNMDCDVEKSFPKDAFTEHFRKFMPFGLSMVLGGLPIALGDPGDAKPFGEVDFGGNSAGKDMVVSDLAASRINGMVDFFIKNKLI